MTDMALPAVSIIVVGYNSRHHLHGCLSALLDQAYPGSFELLFVDNASTDESAAYVRNCFPSVRVLESPGNLGYAGGNNFGARYATGEILAFVNPDTRAEREWLRELVRPFEANPSVGMTTSKIVLMGQPEVINTCGNDVSLAGIASCRYAGTPSSNVTVDEDVPAVSGAACAIRAELFVRLGGFDESFWMYLEDTDLSWRVRAAGYRCVLAARSIIAHEYDFRLSAHKTEVIERNRYRMLSKNLSPVALLALSPQLVLAEVMTWCWALRRGPRYLLAKWLSVVAVLLALPDIWADRRIVQRSRRVADGDLLRQHQKVLPVAKLAHGTLGRVAASVMTPLLLGTAAIALTALRVEGATDPDNGSQARSDAVLEIERGGD